MSSEILLICNRATGISGIEVYMSVFFEMEEAFKDVYPQMEKNRAAMADRMIITFFIFKFYKKNKPVLPVFLIVEIKRRNLTRIQQIRLFASAFLSRSLPVNLV